MRDLISVIIPVYNVEKYLKECVGSIISQTYIDIQIILVDDGSTDRSGEICDRLASVDNRIKVVHKNNGGMSSARNIGLKNANGKYVMFIDSDDYMCIRSIEILHSYICKYDADIASCNFYRFNENPAKECESYSSDSCSIYENGEQFKSLLSKGGIIDTAWGKLYKTEIFDDIEFPLNKYHEDVYTIYKCLAKCKKVVYIPYKLYGYRYTPNSIVTSKFSKKHLDIIEATSQRLLYVEKNYPQYINLAKAEYAHCCCKCYVRMRHEKDSEMTLYKKYLETEIKKNFLQLLINKDYKKKVKVLAFLIAKFPIVIRNILCYL